MIFITGDTDGEIDIRKFNSRKFSEQKNLTKSDFVIVAGDFGLLWDGSNECNYWLNWLSAKNFTTLFIDGNHENFEILNSYPVITWNGGKAHQITNSVIHLMRGQVFVIDGYKFFTFGGAKSSDKEFRKEGVTWWKEEMPNREEYDEGIKNLEINEWRVDYVITHTCPIEVQDILIKKFNKNLEVTELNQYLSEIASKTNYKHWYFGHNHLD
ncbi:MAG: metallophosphoesterase [Ignavibacteriaceae bacterium]|nr:metallophosphoesterase [Ignavibacteriaceae bacterium]